MNQTQENYVNHTASPQEKRFIPNSFVNILFSLIPGAGHMYQGLLSRGATLMAAFAACIVGMSIFMAMSRFGALFTLCTGILVAAMMVVYFFTFFESIKICRLIRMGLKDCEEMSLNGLKFPDILALRKGHAALGVILVALGITGMAAMLINRYVDQAIFEVFVRPAMELLLPLAFVAIGAFLIVKGRKAAKSS